MVRLEAMLACLLVASAASADSARVRWRGVAVEGRAPASLQAAAAAHVAVALRQLGSTVVNAVPADVDASARCTFGAGRAARCVVQVSRAAGSKAERRAEIRFRDAEDLAESLSLLVSDILTSEFPDVVGARPSPPTTPPPPATPPPATPPPPTAAEERQHQEEMARQLALVQKLQREADERAAEQKRADEARRAVEEKQNKEQQRKQNKEQGPRAPSTPPPTRLGVELGALGVFGIGADNPPLAGGGARLTWTRGLLRVGGSVSLSGMRDTIAGHDLTFFRALIALRAGVGVRNTLADFDFTAGPALLVIADDAHAEGRHAFAAGAVVVGPRLALTVVGPMAVVFGADLDVAFTDAKIVSGDVRIAQFSRVSAEVTLGFAWRTR